LNVLDTELPPSSHHTPTHEPIEVADVIEKEADFRSPRRLEEHKDRIARKLDISGEWKRSSESGTSISDPIGHQEAQEGTKERIIIDCLAEMSSPSGIPKIPSRARERRKAIFTESIESSTAELEHHPKSKDQQERLNRALSQHIMFAHLEDEEKQTIFNSMFEVHHKAGASIIKQGDEGDNFYVVESGEIDVYVNREGSTERFHVASIGKDGSFGELALISGGPRAATVIVSLWSLLITIIGKNRRCAVGY
jgi:hypothetical protein